jgi:hypothetical protein
MKRKNLNANNNKGGQSIVEDVFHNYGVKQGPYITDDIKRNIELGKKKYLFDKYTNINKDAEIKYKIARGEYNEIQDNINKENNRLFKYRKLNSENFNKRFELLRKTVNGIGSGFATTLSGIKSTIESLSRGVLNTGNIGKGVIIKTIVLLILIGLLIGALVWFFKSNDPNKTFDYSSDSTSMFFFKTDGGKTSLFTGMFNKINNIIPEQYKVNFNIFKNNINKFFGNDYNGINRETTNEGRYDGINHIKFQDEDKVISMMKPNDIKWNVNFDNYPNIDFNKLPNDLKKKIFDSDKDEGFKLEAVGEQFANDTGSVFIYKMDENKYPFTNSTTKANFYHLKNNNNINVNNYKYTDVPIAFKYENGSYKYPDIEKINNEYKKEKRKNEK